MNDHEIALISGVVRRVKDRPYLLVIPFVVAGVVGAILVRGSTASLQTLTIERADFVREVSVSGSVKAARTVDLAFEQSGRVDAVYVSVGDTVLQAKTLARIDGADAAANVAAKQAALASAQAQLESLKAGAQPQDIQIAQAQADKARQDLANLYASVPPTLADEYAKAADAVHTQLALLFSGADSLSPRLAFSSSESQAVVDSQTKRVQAGLELARWQREIEGLGADSATSSLDVALGAAQGHLAVVSDLLTSVSTAANGATTLPSGIASVAALKAAISAAITEANAAQASATAARSSIASQAILAQQLAAQLALTIAGPKQQDIDAQTAQVAVAQAQVADAQAQAAKTLITAPFGGVITNVNAKVGQIVSPNTPEISMISSGTFQIESYVPEVSIANVRVGDSANVTLDAYGDSVVFAATVVSIDPAETMLDGVSTYKTTLQFNDQDPRVRSGMTASIKIRTASIPNAIAIPAGATYQRDGITYVRVRMDETMQERAVTLDQTSSIGSVVVTSGLSEGDVLVLDPSQ